MASPSREDVWEALSEIFVDNEVDFAAVARAVAGVPRAELERIFFEEVAPFCGPNLMTPVPPIWTGFSREPLVAGIRAQCARVSASRLAAWRHRLWVRCLRRIFATEWRTLRDNLAASGTAPCQDNDGNAA